MTYHLIFKKSNTTGASCGTRIAFSSGAPSSSPYFVDHALSFVLFLLGVVLIVFLRITASDNPLCIFKVVLGGL